MAAFLWSKHEEGGAGGLVPDMFEFSFSWPREGFSPVGCGFLRCF